MIAAAWLAQGLEPPRLAAIGRALAEDVKGHSPHRECFGFTLWGEGSQFEQPQRTVLFGRLDNSAECAAALGLHAGATPSEIYDAALARWGDEADLKLVGHYCAITVEGRQRLRLVRSPWTAPPLHFAARKDCLLASPLLGALFAAGVEKRIDWDHLADQLAYDHHDCQPRGWFEGIGRVPLGSRVRCDGADWKVERYYDPLAVPRVELPSDEAYVERGIELLDEAARHALAGVKAPAIMLSGGLDSPLVAAALLRQLPGEAVLHSYTFGPVAGWDGVSPRGTFGDERERVERFAAMHPRLKAHFPDPGEGGHDHRLRDLLARTQVASVNVANIGIFHPLFEAAKRQGCDAMFTAMHGNFTFSLDADWAPAEALRRGRFLKLRRLLADAHEDEQHSALRRLLSKAVLPNLPDGIQRSIRKAFHPERFGDRPLGSLLSEAATKSWRERAARRRSRSVFDEATVSASREEAIRWMWASADSGEDVDLGMERLHRIAHRDVTAYRPLFEFCHGLPTDQLRRGGTDRFLARRMARGMMPKAQRLERRQGRHNADWHARIGARRQELIAQAEAIRSHGQLSEILDIDRLQHLLRDWPEATPEDLAERLPREMGITRALTAAAFVSHTEQRNDF
ncbi:hypothetical protein K3162_07970 [Qipengyuania xiapuensis]|uniref:Asparagine synthetase domain-containing protein n=1 Tax=Qipengyuania xiapuensis TaxID=2867236 RepID=A0ABX8ZR95_9SPHN|nr:asparagine synthase-related protein [Qipengyuania xiapuensis]QZD91510.1 hypothetical protein K3162_07970 [Qipengyuania xiapuensis]